MKKNKMVFLLGCVHGGVKVPARFQYLFKSPSRRHFLNSFHGSFDKGALELAKKISRALKTPLAANEYSKLLIDLDDSLVRNPVIPFSSITKNLPAKEKEDIFKNIYQKYRRPVENKIRKEIKAGKIVFHLVVHSFSPKVYQRRLPSPDVGLIFYPRDKKGRELCCRWQKILNKLDPNLVVRLNDPFCGNIDCFTDHLRYYFKKNYIGVEIEINQSFPIYRKKEWQKMQAVIVESLKILLN